MTTDDAAMTAWLAEVDARAEEFVWPTFNVTATDHDRRIIEDAPMPAYDGDPDGRRADEAAAVWENRYEAQARWAE